METTRRLLLPPSLAQQKTREDLGIPQIPTLSQPLKDHIFLCYECKVSCLLCSLSYFSKTAWEVRIYISITNKLWFVPASSSRSLLWNPNILLLFIGSFLTRISIGYF